MNSILKFTPSYITFFEHNPNFVQFWSETNINVFKEQHLWPHFRIHNAAFVQDDSFAFLTWILKARPCPFIQILSKFYPHLKKILYKIWIKLEKILYRNFIHIL